MCKAMGDAANKNEKRSNGKWRLMSLVMIIIMIRVIMAITMVNDNPYSHSRIHDDRCYDDGRNDSLP